MLKKMFSPASSRPNGIAANALVTRAEGLKLVGKYKRARIKGPKETGERANQVVVYFCIYYIVRFMRGIHSLSFSGNAMHVTPSSMRMIEKGGGEVQ
jgi:hypothetical protein